jgi:hypothetical protein
VTAGLFQLIIFLCIHRLAPFAFGVFARNLDGEVRKPAGGGGTVPMLNSGGDLTTSPACSSWAGLPHSWVVATTDGNKQNLPAAFIGVVDVPIVCGSLARKLRCR